MNNRYMMSLILLGIATITISDTLPMGQGKRLTTEDGSTYEQSLSSKREKVEVSIEPEQLTQAGIDGLSEFALRRHLKRAFSIYSEVADSKRYNESQRTLLFLAGVNRNLLVNNIPDKLHKKIYPSIVAVELESIEPLLELQSAEHNNFSSFTDNGTVNGIDPDKKYTNYHASTPTAKLDEMIINAKRRGEDTTKLKIKQRLLAYFRTHLDDLNINQSLAAQPLSFTKTDDSLIKLSSQKVFAEWLHNKEFEKELNNFITKEPNLCTTQNTNSQKAHKSEYQKSLSSIHNYFSFLSPKQLKKLSPAESKALHDY